MGDAPTQEVDRVRRIRRTLQVKDFRCQFPVRSGYLGEIFGCFEALIVAPGEMDGSYPTPGAKGDLVILVAFFINLRL